MEARYNGVCPLCPRHVQVGDTIWPLDDTDIGHLATISCNKGENGRHPVGNRHVWVHKTCAAELRGCSIEALIPPVCKHWKQRGTCLVREKCIFSHPEEVAIATRSQLAANEAHRKASAIVNKHGEVEAPIQNRGKGKRNLVRNKARSACFRRFLIDIFGQELLKSGSGVLDVAAGKGEVGFELTRLNSIPVTAVEPRSLELARFVRRMKQGVYHQNPLFLSYIKHKTPQQALSHQVCKIKHMRTLFEVPSTRTCFPTCLNNMHTWQESIDAAKRMTWDRSGLHEVGIQPGRKGKPPPSTTKRDRRKRQRSVRRHWKSLLSSGLSPDQALAVLRKEGVTNQKEAAPSSSSSSSQEDPKSLNRSHGKMHDENDEDIEDDMIRLFDISLDENSSHPTSPEPCAKSSYSNIDCNTTFNDTGNCNARFEFASINVSTPNRSRDCKEDELNPNCVCLNMLSPSNNIQSSNDDDNDFLFSPLPNDHDANNPDRSFGVVDCSDVAEVKTCSQQSEKETLNVCENEETAATSHFVDIIENLEEAQYLISNSSVVFGLHPDQAAEHIVRFAIQHRKPFAVVPCCVYSKEFPTRKLPDGRFVRSYLQLVEYLQGLSPGINRTSLPFEGKNICLYKVDYSDA
eukprot:gene8614-1027_t